MSQWKSPPAGWNEQVVARVAEAIRDQRARRKISAAKLSERTAELGAPMSRAVISDLETGRKRSLELAELIALAAALGVPPVTLIYPAGADVEVLPGHEVAAWGALQWFTGESQIVGFDYDAPSWDRLALQRRMDQLARALGDAMMRELESGERLGDGETGRARHALQQELAAASAALERLNDESAP